MATRQWIFFATICLLTVGVLIACGPETAPVTSTSSESPALTDTPTVDLGVVPFLEGEMTVAGNRPGFNLSTVPALDGITFTPYKRLHTPEGTDTTVRGFFDWSPDGRYVLAHKGSDEVIQIGSLGYALADLYLGDGETGEVRLLQENAGWPSWSRDGHWIYYLTGMKDGDRPRYDLYRRSLETGDSVLVVADVGAPGTEQAAVELSDGRLLLLDKNYRAALFADGVITPLSALAGHAVPQEVIYENYAVAPDEHTVAVFSPQAPLYLVDLDARTLIDTVPVNIDNHRPLAWSADSRRFAFANRDGLFVYDRDTQTISPIVTRKDLGMREEDVTAWFYGPIWSPNEDVLLFGAINQDWEITRGWSNSSGIKFAVTADGSHLRALSDATTLTLSRDKTHGLGSLWDKETWKSVRVLMIIEWRKQ